MANTKYSYSISGDFPNQKENTDSLTQEINASGISTATLLGISTEEDVCDIWFDGPLSAGDQTTLDGVVAAHQGNPPVQIIFHASSVLTDQERTVTDTDPGWTELGGAVTTPSFFTPNLAACKGRVVGMVRSNGTGAKLRICEDTSPHGEYAVPDTEGAWTEMQWFSADPPSQGIHEYRLEGQLPTSGATEVAVKYVAVSLLEFK